jgi:chromosome segregation ATPase
MTTTQTASAHIDTLTGRVLIDPYNTRVVLELGPSWSVAEILHMIAERGYRATGMAVGARNDSNLVKVTVTLPGLVDDVDAAMNGEAEQGRNAADIARIDQLEAQLVTAQRAGREAHQTLTQSQSRIAELETELARTREVLRHKLDALTRERDTVTELRSEVGTLRAAYNQRGQRLDAANDDAERYRSELTEARRILRNINDLSS